MNDKEQIEFLTNQVGWLTNQAGELQRILRQPQDQTLEKLCDHARRIMKQLDNLKTMTDKKN